jgi:uncharacterized protein YjbI with pentapeptide repeats
LSFLDLGDLAFNAANLAGANLLGSDLSGANLASVDLQNAKLDRAKVSRANFSNANLSGASLFDVVGSLNRASSSSSGLYRNSAVPKGTALF